MALFAAWALDSQSEQTARLLNGVFELMKEKYPDDMLRAFASSTTASKTTAS